MINILLLNWNSSNDIQTCVEQIVKSSFSQYRLILIDNYSNEEDKNKLILFYDKLKMNLDMEVHLILNFENFGYAGGNNRGYEYLKKYNLDGDILVINPDVSISENTFEQLKVVLESDSRVGAVMCRTINSDNVILYDYISMNGLNQKWLTTNLEQVNTDYVVGSCMLLRREVIDKTGLFNDNFFMYWEEVDLSFKIKKLGYTLLSTTETIIRRKDNDKCRSYNMNYYMTKNLFLIKKLHSNITAYDLFIILCKRFKESFVDSIKFQDLKYILIFFKGVAHGLKTSVKI